MTQAEVKEMEAKAKKLEKWLEENKGHPNAYLVNNNLKILQLTLKNHNEYTTTDTTGI